MLQTLSSLSMMSWSEVTGGFGSTASSTRAMDLMKSIGTWTAGRLIPMASAMARVTSS